MEIRERNLPNCANYAYCGNKISWRSSRQTNAEIRICAGSLECKRFQQRTNRSRKVLARKAQLLKLEEEVNSMKTVITKDDDNKISKQAIACTVLQTLSSTNTNLDADNLETQDDEMMKNLTVDLSVSRHVHGDEIKPQYMCVRAKADVFTFKMNYLKANKDAMLEEFLSVDNLGKIASYASLPSLVEDVNSSKIVQLPEKLNILFCSSGTAEIYATTEPQKKKRKTKVGTNHKAGTMEKAKDALINTPFYNQYAPLAEECLKHHLAGRIVSCKVGLLSAFIKQRGPKPSVLETAFATKDCVVLWGVPKFNNPSALPSYKKIKKLQNYNKVELLNELKAQKSSPEQIARLTTNHARFGFLCGKVFDEDDRFKPCIEIEELEQRSINDYENAPGENDMSSICLPSSWFFGEQGEKFMKQYIR